MWFLRRLSRSVSWYIPFAERDFCRVFRFLVPFAERDVLRHGPNPALPRIAMLAVALFVGLGVCRAQERVVVLIDTNYPEATLYADSARLGSESNNGYLTTTPP